MVLWRKFLNLLLTEHGYPRRRVGRPEAESCHRQAVRIALAGPAWDENMCGLQPVDFLLNVGAWNRPSLCQEHSQGFPSAPPEVLRSISAGSYAT